MKKLVHGLFGAVMLATVAAGPLMAQETVSECQEKVIASCADAMKDANWVEKTAIGIFCTGRLAGCSVTGVTLKI